MIYTRDAKSSSHQPTPMDEVYRQLGRLGEWKERHSSSITMALSIAFLVSLSHIHGNSIGYFRI